MDRKIKVTQIGCGKMSTYIMRYVFEHGGEVISAFDNDKEKIGKDINYITKDNNTGVLISDIKDLEKKIMENKPDIAIITTMSLLNDIEKEARICLKCGVNVITTCEEAFYSSNSNPYLYKELDVLAKSKNVTITGSGYQDIFWGSLVSNIAASTNKITKIKGKSSYNVEDYGIALASAHGAGLSKEEFAEKIIKPSELSEEKRKELMKERTFAPSYMWNVAGWLSEKLELNITDINQECIPTIANRKIHSNTLNMDLDVGGITGMNAIVRAKTKEGIEIEIECIGKIYDETEVDINEWTVEGEPVTTMQNLKPDTVCLTCADIVGRIPDVINAEAGFVPTCKMPELKYRTKPLNEYIK